MKKLSYILTKSSNWILAGLLSLLGFSSCETTEMYGTPHATYIIKGKVTDEAKRPIPNIQIRSPYDKGIGNYGDTLYTDTQGKFAYKRGWADASDIPLVFTDIDGEKNGGDFASDSINVSFKNIKLEGGDGSWYRGEATQEVTVILKTKKEETNN